MKSPLAPLFLRGEEECIKNTTRSLTSPYQSAGNNRSSASPFVKGGLRGIFFCRAHHHHAISPPCEKAQNNRPLNPPLKKGD